MLASARTLRARQVVSISLRSVLHSADVGAGFEQVRGKAVPECVWSGLLGNSGAKCRGFHRSLELALMVVVTAHNSGARIGRDIGGIFIIRVRGVELRIAD
jgi:hypothetical protein